MTNVQKWLDEKHPKEIRHEMSSIVVDELELEGKLKPDGFAKLKTLIINSCSKFVCLRYF